MASALLLLLLALAGAPLFAVIAASVLLATQHDQLKDLGTAFLVLGLMGAVAFGVTLV